MALVRGDPFRTPEGAVLLSRQEAINFQTNKLENWKNRSETFFLRWGGGILGGATAISSVVILNFLRWRLRLQSIGRFSSYAPVTVIPALGSAVIHDIFIRDKLLIEEHCPVCIEIRSFLCQLAAGVFQPLFLSVVLSFAAVSETGTYPIPQFKVANPSKFYAFTGKLYRQGRSRLIGVILLQLFTSSVVIYKQYEELDILNRNQTEEFSELS